MCQRNPDYDPEICMVEYHKGTEIDCHFTNGDVRRYDIAPAIALGGVYAPLADQEVIKNSLTVFNGCLAFDLKGDRDPYEIVDFCAETVYEKGVSIVPYAVSA